MDHLVGKEITTVIEVMDEVEVISEEVVSEVETVVILEEITAGVEIQEALETIMIKRKRNKS